MIEPVRIEFAPLHALPDVTLTTSAGPIARSFLDRGVGSTRAAAAWLRALPYGFHDAAADAETVFRDGHGTCTSKHATFVALSREAGTPLALTWGTYAWNDAIVTGVGDVLARFNVPFVPAVHCFLRSGADYVDLTEGNCHGKNLQITEYLALDDVEPGADENAHLGAFARRLAATDARFRDISFATLQAASAASREVQRAVCVAQRT